MLLTLIKKEIIQFGREKGNILMMFLFPLVLISVLGIALNGMMSASPNVFKEGKVYYKIEAKSPYIEGFKSFKSSINKEFDGIKFVEVKNLDLSKSEVMESKAYGIITVTNEGFDYFRKNNGENFSAKIFRNIFESVVDKYKLYDVIGKNAPEVLMETNAQAIKEHYTESSVGTGAVSSVDYYTFAELALMILYVAVTVGESVLKERELGTINRIEISKVNKLQLIISKITLGILVGIIQILFVYLYSSIVLKANWGNNLLMMFANLVMLVIFSSVIGAFISLNIKDSKSFNSILNIFIILFGLLGGCYTTPAIIKNIPILGELSVLSPIYWVNSALISISTEVKDNYSAVNAAICLGGSAILIIIALMINKIRGRVKHA